MAPGRLIFLPIMGLLVAGLCAGETSALKLLKTIPLLGVTGRFDHFALDIKGNRLFVAALDNNTLEAIDLTAGKRVQSIPGLGKPTGVLFLPDINRLFVACGDDGNVRVFDGDTLRLLRTISGLEDADNMRFDAKAGLISVGCGSGALAVIDAAKAETISHIKLAGYPESFQLKKNGGRIFVNVPDAQHIAVMKA
jgi:DNA-binding beta-propeller fold protein YncE